MLLKIYDFEMNMGLFSFEKNAYSEIPFTALQISQKAFGSFLN